MLTTDHICTDCRARVHRAVQGLLRIYVQLSIELAHLPVVADGPVSSSAVESRPPLRMNVLELMDRMLSTADAWCAAVSPQLRRRASSRGAAMAAAMKFLRANEDRLLDSPRAAEFAIEMLNLDHRGRRMLGWNRLVHHLPVPCPYCNLLALVRIDGDDRVFCGQCEVAWNHDEYQRLVGILAYQERHHARAG